MPLVFISLFGFLGCCISVITAGSNIIIQEISGTAAFLCIIPLLPVLKPVWRFAISLFFPFIIFILLEIFLKAFFRERIAFEEWNSNKFIIPTTFLIFGGAFAAGFAWKYFPICSSPKRIGRIFALIALGILGYQIIPIIKRIPHSFQALNPETMTAAWVVFLLHMALIIIMQVEIIIGADSRFPETCVRRAKIIVITGYILGAGVFLSIVLSNINLFDMDSGGGFLAFYGRNLIIYSTFFIQLIGLIGLILLAGFKEWNGMANVELKRMEEVLAGYNQA